MNYHKFSYYIPSHNTGTIIVDDDELAAALG